MVPRVLPLLSLALLLVASEASADLTVAGPSGSSGSHTTSASSSSSGHRFYGWQNMIVGGVGVTGVLGIAALSSLDGAGAGDAGPAGGLAGAAYLLGGPIVHLVHDNGFKSLGSLAFLVELPATGAAIGYAAAQGCEATDCDVSAAVWGGVAGGAIAPIVDGLALGWERRRGDRAAAAPTIVPYAVPRERGATVGVVGTF